ncbi:TIGR00297 family protein [Leptolyngbya sp. FACHB-17]|uniref:TIGR00297 family protein n=1 Tax=unclassified Leptolyngbya TaxID=2650499 RepID=UPI001681C09F|nr:TIGR00297 family protein [Leptolyngbya sp. FACHB-17]MBD2082679.1 TIGR00297 family protein [Leptolyngbya sp. FACHB-17]
MPPIASGWLIAIVVNTVLLGVAAIVPKKLLTPGGLANAWILGVIVWGCLGWQGYLLVIFYFLVGSGVTFVGKAQKEELGIAEARSGARGAGNVWGSALVGAICAILVFLLSNGVLPPSLPWVVLLQLGFVASFCTKLSDTCGTEIGKAYGQRTFLITTLKPVPRGTEGAVSLEGTIAGVIGSIAIAIVGWLLGLISPIGVVICAIAAFVATTIESLIGATIEDKVPFLTHDVVNILNTLIGAIVAIAIGLAF